jgi:magnesium transporter
MDEFDIDPSFANELLTSSYKPKVERRGELIYLILHFPLLRGMGKVPEEEIDFLIGKNFLITARYAQSDPLHSFAKAFEVNSVLGHNTAALHGGHLFAAMARNLYRALATECDVLERHLGDIEEHIFNADERSMVVRLSQTGRIIHDFRQRLIPHKEMLTSLEPQATKMFGPEFLYYIRAVEGDYERVRTILENLREALIELRETNNSLLSTKQNETIKTFTVIAFFFLPLTFIAALFSMHTIDTPLINTPGGFWIVLSIMALLAGIFFVYFKRKGWL